MQEKEYRNSVGISQSAIKDFRFKSPRKWKRIWIDGEKDIDKKDETFVFGSLVDCLLFTPHLLEERYYISNAEKIPTGATAKIISSVYNTYKATSLDVPDMVKKIDVYSDPNLPTDEEYEEITYDLSPLRDVILQACIDEDWNGKWKPDTRINKIIETGTEYFSLLDMAFGREVISSEMNIDAINLVAKLRNDESVKQYFIEGDDYQNIHQLEIHTKYTTKEGEEDVKGALDIFHINHKDKTLQIIDFKTTYSAFDFLKIIKQFSYVDQLSFYQMLIEQYLLDDDFKKKYNIGDDYRLIPPINIAIDKDERIPYIYEYDWFDLNIAKSGNASHLEHLYGPTHNHKIKKGWEEILTEIIWHMKNNKYEYPREYYKQGRIKVNLLNQ